MASRILGTLVVSDNIVKLNTDYNNVIAYMYNLNGSDISDITNYNVTIVPNAILYCRFNNFNSGDSNKYNTFMFAVVIDNEICYINNFNTIVWEPIDGMRDVYIGANLITEHDTLTININSEVNPVNTSGIGVIQNRNSSYSIELNDSKSQITFSRAIGYFKAGNNTGTSGSFINISSVSNAVIYGKTTSSGLIGVYHNHAYYALAMSGEISKLSITDASVGSIYRYIDFLFADHFYICSIEHPDNITIEIE